MARLLYASHVNRVVVGIVFFSSALLGATALQLDVVAVGSLDVSNSLSDGRNLVRRDKEHLPWNRGGFQAAAPSPTPPPAAPPLAPAPQAAPPKPGQPGISEVRSAPASVLSGPVIWIIGLLVAVSCIAAIVPYVINRSSAIDKVGSDEQGAVPSGNRGASSVAKSSYKTHRQSRKGVSVAKEDDDAAEAPLLAAEQKPESGASTSSGTYRSKRQSRTPAAAIEEEAEERVAAPNERQAYRTNRAAKTSASDISSKAVDEVTSNAAETAPLEAPVEIQKPQSYRSQRASRKPMGGKSAEAADEQISNTEGIAEVKPSMEP